MSHGQTVLKNDQKDIA